MTLAMKLIFMIYIKFSLNCSSQIKVFFLNNGERENVQILIRKLNFRWTFVSSFFIDFLLNPLTSSSSSTAAMKLRREGGKIPEIISISTGFLMMSRTFLPYASSLTVEKSLTELNFICPQGVLCARTDKWMFILLVNSLPLLNITCVLR